MAWLKISKDKLVNLDNVFDITYGTYMPTLNDQCYSSEKHRNLRKS